jgi:hypothetical protein
MVAIVTAPPAPSRPAPHAGPATGVPRRPTTPPPGGPGRARPSLTLVEGGRAAGGARTRYRRRRLVAAVLCVVFVMGLVRLADAAVAGLASPGPAAAPSAAGPAAVHVVQPGDTLWSIAGQIAPDTDVRITVDRLVELNGGAAIVVGQRLVLPE